MRTATITLAGEERLLCFSTRVLLAVNAKFGDLEDMFDQLRDSTDTEKSMKVALWMLAQMMNAGYRYAQHEGIETGLPLTEDMILDLCSPLEIMDLGGKVQEALAVGTSRDIEVKPPKNAKAGAVPKGKPKTKRAPSGGSGTGSTSA